MPVIQITSPSTGRQFKVSVSDMPTSADIEQITAQYDAANPLARNADESMAQALKKSSQAGVFPGEKGQSPKAGLTGVLSQQTSDALAMGAGEGATAGLEGALFSRYGGVNRNAPDSPAFTNPYTYAASELIGGAAPFINPVGQIVRRASSLAPGFVPFIKEYGKNVLKAGAAALGFGAVGGAAEKIADPTTNASDIASGAAEGAKSTLTNPAAIGAVAAAGLIPPLLGTRARQAAAVADLGTKAPIAPLGQRFNPKAMPEQQRRLETITNFPESDVRANRAVQDGSFLPVVDSVRPFFKQGSGAEGLLAAGRPRLAEMRSQVDPLVENFPKNLAHTPDQIRAMAEKNLSETVHNAATRKELLDQHADIFENVEPSNILDKASTMNDQLSPDFQRDATVTAEQKAAKHAIRDALSEAIHGMLDYEDPSGEASKLYTQSGLLGQLLAQVDYSARNLTKERMGASVQPVVGKVVKSIITQLGGPIYKGKKIVGIVDEAHGPGSLGQLNSQINKMFEAGPASTPVINPGPKTLPPNAPPPWLKPPPPAPPAPPTPPPAPPGPVTPAPIAQQAQQQSQVNALTQWLQSPQQPAPTLVPQAPQAAVVPETVVPKAPAKVVPKVIPNPKYTPEQQAALAAAKERYDKDVVLTKQSLWPEEQKQSQLKGAGMRYAAEKRQITGELTAKEAAAKTKREASNFIGKQVSVQLEGEEAQNAKVVGNSFGRVKVELKDGTTMHVDPEQVGTPVKETYRKLTDTQGARILERERRSEAHQIKKELSTMGIDARTVLKEAGGIMTAAEAEEKGHPLKGELRLLKESPVRSLMRRGGLTPDQAGEVLRHAGFGDIQTEADVLNVLDEISRGHKVYPRGDDPF